MAGQERPALSEAERAVLKVLWEHGPAPVREIHELLGKEGQEWTRSTVITLLQRLEKKSYAASDKSQFAFVFRAAVSREELAHQELRKLAEELLEGDAVPLVLNFARRHRFTSEEIEQFRQLIDKMEAKAPRRKSTK